MITTTLAQDADTRRSLARLLLTHPILTTARYADEVALVRRHATALKSMFAGQLGYPLIIESTFARLVKDIPDPAAPPRPLRRVSDDRPLTARGYVHLALVCAALLAPGTGEQILISALVDQVRADAADQSLMITDAVADRRQLVAVLSLLIDWGILTEADGSVVAWGERSQDEALLSINRAVLAHVLPGQLYRYETPAASLVPADDDQPRRRLRRKLVEHPVLLRQDLTDAELDVLSRERTDLTRQLYENFGLVLEVRAEGVLAYDPAGELTDIEFPGGGTLKQAALLLLDELITSLTPESGGPTAGPVVVPWETVDTNLARVLNRHHRAGWRADYRSDPDLLRDDIVSLLSALSLVDRTERGLMIMPVAARYRPRVTVSAQGALFPTDPGEGGPA